MMPPSYIPILSVRPSELAALRELPDVAYESILPFIVIRPWLGKGALSRALDKVKSIVGDKTWIAGFDSQYDGSNPDHAAEIESIKDPKEDYSGWKNFVGTLPNAIPSALIIEDTVRFSRHIENLLSLNRGICIRIGKDKIVEAFNIIDRIKVIDSNSTYFILDFEDECKVNVEKIELASEIFRRANKNLPQSNLAVSMTSFPSSFIGLEFAGNFRKGISY